MLWTQGFKLDVERHQAESKAVVTLTGCIDVGTAEQVKTKLRALSEEGHAVIELDLSEVTYLDSTGLSTLLRSWTEMKRQGRSLIITEASSRVRRVLSAVRLDFLLGEPI